MTRGVGERGPEDGVAEASLESLVRLRWASVLCQLALVLGVRLGLGIAIPLPETLLLVAVGAASNLALTRLPRRRFDPRWLVGAVLFLDCALLSALLYVSGGASNPFSVLFLVHVTLAAVSASRRVAIGVLLAAALGYALLFLAPALPGDVHVGHAHAHHGGGDPFSAHLQGMWLAFALTASLIAYSVSGLARTLAAERDKASRSARLVALSTLAAGAAHELLTPLSTIRLAAGEIDRALAARPELAPVRDDARLIETEVARSREVLDRLRVRSGELVGEPVEAVTLGEIEEALGGAIGSASARVTIRRDAVERRVRVPRRALTFALSSLVKNALDAREDGRVDVTLGGAEREVRVAVRDEGRGMSPGELARAGEPFFTTKAPGDGMGLGLFIARSLVEQLGGRLELVSEEGRGTTATVLLPAERTEVS